MNYISYLNNNDKDQKRRVSPEKRIEIRQQVVNQEPENEQQEYFDYVCASDGLEMPTHWKDALPMYEALKQKAEQTQ